MSVIDHSTDAVLEDSSFAALSNEIVAATGLAFYAKHSEALAQHVVDRLKQCRFDDCRAYLQLLRDPHHGPDELDALTVNLTIGETFFFRHQEMFEALATRVLPELIDRNRAVRRLRIWSAGCAIGAEPYSLSILLKRDFGVQLSDWNVSIIATDINRAFLAQAQHGEFSEWALRSMSDQLKEECFIRRERTWQIRDEYRRNVSFQFHNLVQHPFPSLINGLSAFDVILCRNVMIYFERQVAQRLVCQFHDTLAEGGWLVVGPVEASVETFRAFETINSPDAVLYRKRSSASSEDSPPFRSFNELEGTFVPRLRSEVISSMVAPDVFVGCKEQIRPSPPHEGGHVSCDVSKDISTLSEAQAFLNRGALDAAADACRDLLHSDPMNPAIYFFQSLVAEQQGRSNQAEQSLRKAIYLNRDFILAHYHLGLLRQRHRDAVGAQRSYRNVLALLQDRNPDETFSDADGLTAGALGELTNMQIEVLQRT